MNVRTAIIDTKSKLNALYDPGEAAAIVEVLFSSLLKTDRSGLRMIGERDLTLDEAVLLERQVQELCTHRPLQYVLGLTEFYGLSFKVDESVLIPRPETEELVLKALKWIGKRTLRVLEVGTGSGCIAIALKKNAPQIEMVSLDVSKEALAIAAYNAKVNDVAVMLRQCDFLDEANWAGLGYFDMVISNPPYILQEEARSMDANVLRYEPHQALFVTNGDVQQFYRKILAFADKAKGRTEAIFLELNQSFAAETLRLYTSGNWDARSHKDLNGNDRMLTAFRL